MLSGSHVRWFCMCAICNIIFRALLLAAVTATATVTSDAVPWFSRSTRTNWACAYARVLAYIWNNFKEFGWIVSLIRICNCLSIYSSFWMHVCVCVAIHVSLRVKFVSKIYWIVKMYLKNEARAPVNWKKIKKFIWCTYSLFVRRFQRHFVENDELLESLAPFVMVDVSPCCVKLRFERQSPSFSSFALTYNGLHTDTHT